MKPPPVLQNHVALVAQECCRLLIYALGDFRDCLDPSFTNRLSMLAVLYSGLS